MGILELLGAILFKRNQDSNNCENRFLVPTYTTGSLVAIKSSRDAATEFGCHSH